MGRTDKELEKLLTHEFTTPYFKYDYETNKMVPQAFRYIDDRYFEEDNDPLMPCKNGKINQETFYKSLELYGRKEFSGPFDMKYLLENVRIYFHIIPNVMKWEQKPFIPENDNESLKTLHFGRKYIDELIGDFCGNPFPHIPTITRFEMFKILSELPLPEEKHVRFMKMYKFWLCVETMKEYLALKSMGRLEEAHLHVISVSIDNNIRIAHLLPGFGMTVSRANWDEEEDKLDREDKYYSTSMVPTISKLRQMEEEKERLRLEQEKADMLELERLIAEEEKERNDKLLIVKQLRKSDKETNKRYEESKTKLKVLKKEQEENSKRIYELKREYAQNECDIRNHEELKKLFLWLAGFSVFIWAATIASIPMRYVSLSFTSLFLILALKQHIKYNDSWERYDKIRHEQDDCEKKRVYYVVEIPHEESEIKICEKLMQIAANSSVEQRAEEMYKREKEREKQEEWERQRKERMNTYRHIR